MRHPLSIPVSITGTIVAITTIVGCAVLSGAPTAELLTEPSVHVMVSTEQAPPTSGTYDFDTKLFKMNYTDGIDLSAIDSRVVSSLKAVLGKKGFEQVDEEPDLLVSYAVALDSPILAADFNEAYADEFPIAFPQPSPSEELNYNQGALIVDVVDRRERRLLWRGAIMADVSMTVSDDEKDRRVAYGVRLLLEHFPMPVGAVVASQ